MYTGYVTTIQTAAPAGVYLNAFDPATFAITKKILISNSTGTNWGMTVVSADGSTAYTAFLGNTPNYLKTNIASGVSTIVAFSKIDNNDNAGIDGQFTLALSPDGSRLYMATAAYIRVISTATDTVLYTIATDQAHSPYHFFWGLAPSPDGSKLFVGLNQGAGGLNDIQAILHVYRTSDYTIIGSLVVKDFGTFNCDGINGPNLYYSAENNVVYVSSYAGGGPYYNNITTVDAGTLNTIAAIDHSHNPFGSNIASNAWAMETPNGARAFTGQPILNVKALPEVSPSSLSAVGTLDFSGVSGTPTGLFATGPDDCLYTPASIAGSPNYHSALYKVDLSSNSIVGTIDLPGQHFVLLSNVSLIFTYVGPRQCRRLAEPSPLTVEQINNGALSIYVTLPIDIVNRYASLIPSSGPDTLIINYTDYQGQPAQLTRNLTLWMSDTGYVFIGTDNATQFLVAGVNGPFFDANATAINNRNTTNGASPLAPCENLTRYDAPKLLPNQALPATFIRDGVTLQ